MKYVLIVSMLLCSTRVLATKSRMKALGQDPLRGSFYMDDARTVFANPANVNIHTDYAVFEWGERRTDGEDGEDPTPEGGFFRDTGGLTYGVYLGGERISSESHLQNRHNRVNEKIDELSGNNTDYGRGNRPVVSETNAIDIFLGGDMGTEWGARIHYASAKDKTPLHSLEGKHDALALGLGIIHGPLDIYANYTLVDDHEGFQDREDTSFSPERVNSTLKNDDTMDVGVSYSLLDWTLFAHYDKRGSLYGEVGQGEQSYGQSILTLGAGHTHQISSMARFFTDISYVRDTAEASLGEGGPNEAKSSTFPITVAFEADATPWLSLRGSIRQSLFGTTEVTALGRNYEESDHTTDVAAGATLNFGKLKIDGMIGVNDDNAGEDGVLSHTTLTRVAVHYWF